MSFASWLFRRFFPWIDRGWREEVDIQRRLAAISFEDAERIAKAFLWNGGRFRVVPNPIAWSGVGHPSVAILFDGAESFDPTRGELRLSRALVEASSALPGWDKIGEGIEHTEVLVNRTTGEAIDFDGDLAALEHETTYPSIFHLLIRFKWDLWPALSSS